MSYAMAHFYYVGCAIWGVMQQPNTGPLPFSCCPDLTQLRVIAMQSCLWGF